MLFCLESPNSLATMLLKPTMICIMFYNNKNNNNTIMIYPYKIEIKIRAEKA
jgi:hypothetical protein